jgi:hypothetical protein
VRSFGGAFVGAYVVFAGAFLFSAMAATRVFFLGWSLDERWSSGREK